MDDDDLDILNDADELAFFDKLDTLGKGITNNFGDEEEEEELLVIPSKPNNAKNSKLSYNDQEDTGTSIMERAEAKAESPGYGSVSVSPKRNVSFRKLEGINAFQDRNRDLIRSQSNFLHPRAVLFVGSVLSITLPTTSTYDPDDCDLMYRVLFIEGGNQPAMFRCKTPIFTSSITSLSHQVAVWDDNTFRFDMLMPEAEPGEDPHYLNIQGEVMLAIYRKKSNGGNDLVAQFTVDLQRLKARGTKEIFEKDNSGDHDHTQEMLEGRSMNGIFPLPLTQTTNSRSTDAKDSGQHDGQIEIQFNIAWHRSDPRGTGGGASDDENGGSRHGRSQTAIGTGAAVRRSSATASSVGGGGQHQKLPASSATAASRPKTTTNAVTNKNKMLQVSATNQYKYEQPRKIVSKHDRQRREMERKIAKENQLLHSRLAKHVPDQGPNKSRASATLSQNKVTAYQNYDAVLSTVKKTGGPESIPNNPRIIAIDPDILEKDSPQWRHYQQQYDALKRDIRDEENKIQDLKAKLSNINTQIQRQEASVDKVRMLTNTMSRSQAGAAPSSSSSNGHQHHRHHHHGHTDGGAGGEDDNRGEEGGGGGEDDEVEGDDGFSDVQQLSQLAYMPGSLENVTDGEYVQLAEEFNVLQTLRRSLLERIAEAKKFSGNAKTQQQDLDGKLLLVKHRLWHLKRNHTDDFQNIILMNEAPPPLPLPSLLSGEGKTTKGGVGVGGGGEEEKETDLDDLTMYDRLLAVRTEIASMQVQGGFSQTEAGGEVVVLPSGPAQPEVLALQSTRCELDAMLHKLNTQIEKAAIDVSRLEQEQTEKLALVSDVAGQREWIDRRSFIADMHAMELRLKREERLNAMVQATKDIDLQLIHYRMVTKERDELKAHKEMLEQQQQQQTSSLLIKGNRPTSPSPESPTAAGTV